MESGVTSSGDSMAEALDMLSVAVTPRPLSQIIAWRRQLSVSYGEFLDRTRAWQRLLTRTSGQTFALSISDAAEFAAALFGAWQARKTIYLPGDRLPRTWTSELSERVRAASPETTVVLWMRDEEVMEVVGPGASEPRRVFTPVPEELRSELMRSQLNRVER